MASPKEKAPVPRPGKSGRLMLRVSPEQKRILQQAAQIQSTSMTNFILQQSCEAAKEVVAAELRIVLDAEQWRAFSEALDSPRRDHEGMRRLLTEPSVLD